MDRLKIFRLTTLQYFVAQFALAEGSTEAIRKEIWPTLVNSPGMRELVGRLSQMNTRQRCTSIGSLINLLKIFDTTTRTISQPDWVNKVNKIFEHGGSESSNNAGDWDRATGVYEVLHLQVSSGGASEHLSNVLKGCSLVSLDQLFISADIQNSFRKHIWRDALEGGNSWRIKSAYRDVEMFVRYLDAANVCRMFGNCQKAQAMIRWLEEQAHGPPDDLTDPQKLRLLEAIDGTKYIIALLGTTPGTGNLVLLRASDGHVHATSFMRACVGMPLLEQDVLDDDACARLTDLLDGPVNLVLDDAQMDALTLTDRPAIVPRGS